MCVPSGVVDMNNVKCLCFLAFVVLSFKPAQK